MILFWGAGSDPQFGAARAALEKLRRAVVLVDQDNPADAVVDLSVGERVAGSVKVGKKKVDSSDLTAAYVRVRDPRAAAAVQAAGPGSALWTHALALDGALQAWTEVSDANVIHPRAVASAQRSKPRQARLIEGLGFSVPAALVTTDPAAARAFQQRHRDVIYKSVAGARSWVSRLTPEKLGRLELIRNCPTHFQERVEGVDHRVHVFGDEVFACALEHDADDHRAALAEGRLRLRDVALDAGDADRFRKLAAGLELAVAGIDLRRRPDGEWVCFEVEPSPAFARYDAAPPRMAESLARMLLGDRTNDRRQP